MRLAGHTGHDHAGMQCVKCGNSYEHCIKWLAVVMSMSCNALMYLTVGSYILDHLYLDK